VRQARLDDRGVELPAIDEYRGEKIQEHQRNDDGREAGIHRHIVVGEARQILPEHGARHHRGCQGENDARQDLQESPAAGRKPGMQDEEGDHQRQNRDAVARDVEKILIGFDDHRNVAPHGLDDQGAKHDQEGHRQRGDGGKERVADRFQPQPIPSPRLDYRISAIERDAKGFDAVGGKVDGKHRADRQDVATGRRQDIMDFSRQRIGNLLRPDLKQESSRLVGEFFRAEETRQRRQHDQERKQRHQRRQCDVTGDRPAVIGKKRVERIDADMKNVANLPHGGP